MQLIGSSSGPKTVNSREELVYLLSRAAELEHGLACVYLFAAYSLKSDVDEGGLDPEQAQMVRNWKRRLAGVAVEEMLHLGFVSNMLTAIGGAPNFKRTNFPMDPGAYPIGIQLTLEPFSRETIERLLCFEMPEAGILSEAKQRYFDEIAARVRTEQSLRLGPQSNEARAPGPFEVDYRTVGELYHKIESGFTSIPEEKLFIGPREAQANARYLDLGGQLTPVVDRASACAAIERIVEQGEAPKSDHPDAHFAVFDTIRREFERATADAEEHGIPFEPVRPVVSNPMTQSYCDTKGGCVVADPLTHELSDIFNVCYDTMLLMLVRFFSHTDETEEELRLLARGTLRLMASVLRPLGEALAKMPAGEGHPGKTAGPGFGYNRDVDFLPHKSAAWTVFLERLSDLVERTNRLVDEHAVLPQVEEALAAMRSVGDHLVKFIPQLAAHAMNFEAREEQIAPTITCEKDGPYLVTDLQHFSNSLGETLATRRTIALCRCGGSAIKPYCDGTHARNHFSSAKLPNRTADKLDSYEGDGITIHDNRGTCCHSGNCTDNLPSVFRTNAEPFVDPKGADTQSIISIIRQCPSGALGYTIGGTNYLGEERDPAIYVSKDGPYHVQGSIELRHEERNSGASFEHYALCRCGHSKNKPFCDGTHWYVGFKDEDN